MRTMSYPLAHMAVPFGGRQDARYQPKYLQYNGLSCTNRPVPRTTNIKHYCLFALNPLAVCKKVGTEQAGRSPAGPYLLAN
jgi:hypothetical protein